MILAYSYLRSNYMTYNIREIRRFVFVSSYVYVLRFSSSFQHVTERLLSNNKS